MFEIYKDQHSACFEIFTLYRKMLFAIALVLIYDKQTLQLLTISVANLVYIILLFRFKPYKNKVVQNLKLLSEGIFFLAFVMMMAFPVFEE